MRSWKLGVLVCFLVAASTLGLRAQTLGTATVTGTVRDPSGAAIPGAQVELRDTATNIAKTTESNAVGHYVFVSVQPGTYTLNVTAQGFRTYSVAPFKVLVGTVYTFDAPLQVGAVRQTVQVEASAGAELQTLNSTMGSTVAGDTLISLPSVNRDATSLMLFQPMTAPTFGGSEGNITGGQIAGSMSDQNTFMLDGGNATSDLEGDNNYVAGNRTYVGPQAAIPTPLESIEEFKINTNNMTADFASSAGAQIQMVTKRGSNAYHGSVYDYFQADWLNANSWDNNRHGVSLTKQHQNRFGGSFGGTLLPNWLGGKTYFYTNYEGRRYPYANSLYERQVPSATLRQGIITIRDATNTPVPYDLATSSGCGTLYTAPDSKGNTYVAGPANLPCDPRAVGISPLIQKLWTQYMPMPNDVNADGSCKNYGDLLNNCGYFAPLKLPIKEDFIVGRIDHDFGSKWRWMTSYRYYRDINPSTNQVDIGGFLPGDKLGTPTSVSANVMHPIYFVTGLTTNITPSLTNQFHLNYLRNDWQWQRAGVANAIWQQNMGVPGGLEVGGETTNPMAPYNFDTQNARFRTWNGHDWNYIDNLSWLKGNHFFQFGGQFVHWWDHHIRPDNVTGSLTGLVYQINKGNGLLMDPTWQPTYCNDPNDSGGGTLIQTNCMPVGRVGTWNSLYSETLGFIGQAQKLFVRGGNDFHLTGAPALSDFSITDQYSMYFSDSWKIRPNLTLNYGLAWGVQMPPYEINGVQDYLTDADGNTINFQSYLDNRRSAALAGQVYNPNIGFMPIRAVGGHPKYPFNPFYGGFGPRVSVAWSPAVDSGFFGRIFGNKKSVIRGGYARIYDRTNAVNLVMTPLLGYGFGQPIRCRGGRMDGVCTNAHNGTDPTDGFRIGVDGSTAPFPAVSQTLPIPAMPGVNSPAASVLFGLDSKWHPGIDDQFDLSFQRELPGQVILEMGWSGRWATHIYMNQDTNLVPYMTTLNGQSFVKAWSNLFLADTGGTQAAPQPFLEAALAGSPFCDPTKYTSCTAAVQAQEGIKGNQYITYDDMYDTWADLDSHWTAFGPALPENTQGYAGLDYATTSGFSNYQAGIVSVQKRTSHGLMMNANFTWSHTLGPPIINGEYVEATPSNPWNLRADYSPVPWDQKFVLNVLATYDLPFGKGRKWLSHNSILDRLVGGWEIAPLFSRTSGLVIESYTGSCLEFGSGLLPWCAGMVPITNTRNLSHSVHSNVVVDPNSAADNVFYGQVAVNGNYDPKNGYTGIQKNMFPDPIKAYNGFRSVIAGIDGRAHDEGPVYGMPRWNLDMTISKNTRITERVGATFYCQMLNALNHMMWGNPFLDVQDPYDFGVIGGQYGMNRVIELGLRVHF